MTFLNKTVFITGASRGIGKAIALAFAKKRANVACFAKTTKLHQKLPGSLCETVEEVERLGGKGLVCTGDVRFQGEIEAAVSMTVKTFGGIDVLVNNASAINLTPTLSTTAKSYDLMHQVNVRGTFLCSQACLPHLLRSKNPHIINLSPPLDMDPKWFSDHLCYTMTKFGMSMCVIGMSAEFKSKNVAVNAVWPKTGIYTSAMEMLAGAKSMEFCRKPEIIADCVTEIVSRDSKQFTGNLLIDEDFLRSCGVTDFEKYSCVPGQKTFFPDLFVQSSEPSFIEKMKSELSSTGNSGQTQSSDAPVDESIKAFFDKVLKASDKGKLDGFDLTVNVRIDFGTFVQEFNLNLSSSNKGCSTGHSPRASSLLSTDIETFRKILKGELDQYSAFFTGKVKIKGPASKAMEIANVFKAIQ